MSPTEDQIAALESRLGASLPDDYRLFLRQFAFTHVSGLCFRSDEHPGMEGGGVEVFFGIRPKDGYDLLDNWEGMQGRVPEGLLPIADSPGGLICLSLRDRDRGAVYHWSEESCRGRGMELEFIAPSFSGFLNHLYLE